MTITWQEYQSLAASFFRSLGLEAETDVSLKGARTAHDVDAVVKSKHVGFEVTWLVECKHWKSAVSKLHVLALRTIVADVGADRGILLSEAGFQSGAFEAAQLTNVRVSSLEELKSSAQAEIHAMRLRELYDRSEVCREAYWNITKEDRIRRGLRPDLLECGYSGTHVLNLLSELFPRAFRDEYPISLDTITARMVTGFEQPISTREDLIIGVARLVRELEEKLGLKP